MAIWCLRNGLDSESSDESFDSEGCKKPTVALNLPQHNLYYIVLFYI